MYVSVWVCALLAVFIVTFAHHDEAHLCFINCVKFAVELWLCLQKALPQMHMHARANGNCVIHMDTNTPTHTHMHL